MENSKAKSSEADARTDDIKYALHLVRENVLVLAGTILAVFYLVISVTANYLVEPSLANKFDFAQSYCWSNSAISWGRNIETCIGINPVLGTDGFGRDLLKMIVLAIPIDIGVALIIVISSTILGVVLGAVAAEVGGKVDEIILRITDIFLAFPSLLLALVFAAIFGRTMQNLIIAVLLVWWPLYVRLIRGQVLSEKERNYVEALRALGIGRTRVLFMHIIPNTIYPILVQSTLDVGGVILTFSALMFLGFSPNPAMPELGNLAADGIGHVFTAPWLIVFPGLTIVAITLAFNLIGDGLRDVLDPRLRR
jgi:peptide/nickel transport system permease protein